MTSRINHYLTTLDNEALFGWHVGGEDLAAPFPIPFRITRYGSVEFTFGGPPFGAVSWGTYGWRDVRAEIRRRVWKALDRLSAAEYADIEKQLPSWLRRGSTNPLSRCP